MVTSRRYLIPFIIVLTALSGASAAVAFNLLGSSRRAPALCDGDRVTIRGTSAGERLVGTSGSDIISGGGGADRIRGLGGNDILCGGRGNDVLRGGSGNDIIKGGRGRDQAFGGAGTDVCRAERTTSCNETEPSPTPSSPSPTPSESASPSPTPSPSTPTIPPGPTNQPPSNITLSNDTIPENEPSGTPVGTFTATDPDSPSAHAFSLVSGTGDTDNASFAIVGDELRTDAVLDFEAQPTYDIRVRATDDALASFEKTFTITTTDGNDGPPTLTTSGGTPTFIEDGAPVVIDNGLTISDDGANLESATVTITGSPQPGDELLFVTTTSITGTYNSGTSVLTLTGTDTVADYEAALRSVEFDSTAQAPLPTKTISFVVDDGDFNSSAGTADVSFTAVNDAPVNTMPTSPSVTEDTPGAISGVSVADVDAGSSPIEVEISITNGTLSVTPLTGLTFTAGDGTSDATMTFSGTLTHINAALGGLTYSPATNYSGSSVLSLTSDDQGATGGPALTDTDASNVDVVAVDDNPTAVADSATVNEDSSLNAIDVLANDSNADGGPLTVNSVNTTNTDGDVTITGGGTGVTYSPDPHYCNDPPGTSPDTFTYTLNGGSTVTVSMTVTCVDDAPDAVNDSATVLEDAAATTIPVLTNDTDIDGGPKAVSQVDTTGTNGVVTITNAGADVSYEPNDNYCNTQTGGTPDEFTYTVNGSDSATVSVTVTCVNDAPVADDETFSGASRAIGNTSLVVNDTDDAAPDPTGPQKTVTGDILLGDNDVDGPGPLTITAETKATSDGGSVTIEADGDFTYINDPADLCLDSSDTFTYTVEDGSGTPAGTDTGTVTITIADCVWYVDALGSAGSGTSQSPFNNMTAIDGAGGAGDSDGTGHVIFLYDGTYSGGLPLENNQNLFSQRHGLSMPDGGVGTVILEPNAPSDPTTTVTGGLILANGNTIQGIELGNHTTAALSGSSVGTAVMNTVTSGAITNTTGGAVDITTGALNMTFTSVSSGTATQSPATTGDGIRLVSTTGTFTAPAGSLQNMAGQDVEIDGGTVGFTYGGSISDDQGQLVLISNQTGGTKDFNGAITDLNDGDGNGISLSSNTGATMRFDGGLTLSTGTSNGLVATGGGALAVTNQTGGVNTIATSTGTALNVTNTTIQDDDLTFRSIAASDPTTSGIILNTTANANGRLVVAGNGGSPAGACTGSAASCTGGIIDGAGLSGISLTNVPGGVSLTRMLVEDSFDDGIFASNVGGGLTLENSRIFNNGNANGDSGLDAASLTGTVALTNDHFVNNFDNNVSVINTSGTMNMTVSGTDTINSGAHGGQGDGIFVEAQGTGNHNLSVLGGTYQTNVGDHVQYQSDAANTSDNDVTITGTTMTSPESPGTGPCATGVNAAPILGGGITVVGGGNSNTDATLSNNNIQESCIGAIAVGTTGSVADPQSAQVDATISNNTIGTVGNAGSGSVQGNGIFVDSNGNGFVRTLITNNVIRQWTNRSGIFLDIIDGDAEMHATVKNNILTDPNSAFAGTSTRGMTIQLGTGQAGDSIDACLDIGDAANNALKNQVAGTGEGPSQPDVRYLHEGPGSVVSLVGYSGVTNPTIANIANWFQPRNNLAGTPTVTGTSSTAGPPASTTQGAASCQQPS